MKRIQPRYLYTTALAMLLVAITQSAVASTDLVIGQFQTGTPGVTPSGCGTWYGPGVSAWDNTVDATPGGGGGAVYISCPFRSDQDSPSTVFICLPGENPWWHQPTAINLSDYKSIQFDLLWDNVGSDITIDQFNNPATFPTNYLQTWAPTGYLAGSIQGFDMLCAYGDGSPSWAWLTNFAIPSAASNGWVHITLPYNHSTAGIDGGSGILFKKWLNQQWGISGVHYANFWVDNVFLEGTVPPPPPNLAAPFRASQGLNIFSSTAGINDRQSAELMITNGICWVGHASSGNQVTYSFTVKDFPTDPATGFALEAYMFLIPNLVANDGAPDWNETNCIVLAMQSNPNGGAYMNFRYKVDEDHQQQMYYGNDPYTNAPGSWDGVTPNYFERGNLGFVGSTTPNGTWSLQFTSDTNAAIISPNGNSNSFVLPPYFVSRFAGETNFVIYLGMQANNTASLNRAVVYSSFSITGAPTNFSENFLAESVLDTTNTWRTSVATGPAGVRIVPAGSAWWASWSLPDSGFSLQSSPSLTGPWTTLTNGPVIPLANARGQLISDSEAPGGGAAFFRMIK